MAKSTPAPPVTLKIQLQLDSYPRPAAELLLSVRSLIYQCAAELAIKDLEESLKWREPAYSCKKGSTIRIDYKPVNPEYCAVYFHCQSKLIETFKTLYGDVFTYEGKRAILLPLNRPYPTSLAHCLRMALQYHSIKHLPLLGA